MPRLTKIYTRTGDDGTTSLGDRQRVSKDSLRVTAYGQADELNALIGLALAVGLSDRLDGMLTSIQNDLFHLGADLAFPQKGEAKSDVPRIGDRHVGNLESWIDEIQAVVGALDNFILPGGSLGASQLHVARTVCRRAERSLVALAAVETVNPHGLRYLNRLSDLLFVMARFENREHSIVEPLWDSRA